MDNIRNKNEILKDKEIYTETSLINIKKSSNEKGHTFTVSHTQIAKGISSLMLLYHHLLRPGNKFIKHLKNELIFFGIDFRRYTSVFFKITTCSYTFLSGIGIYYSLNKFKSIKNMYIKCIRNFLRLMIIFWIILIFAYPKGLHTRLFNLNYSTIISCIFADYKRKGNWWYIRMHFALLIYSPLFVRLFQDINYKNKILPFTTFYFFYFIIRYIQHSYKFRGILINILFHYFKYFSEIDIILSFFVGILSAKYDLISIYHNSKPESIYYSLFSILSAVFIRCNLITQEGSTKIDFFIVPLFIMPITSIIYKNKYFSSLFKLFGKHSTNFCFIHGYFYDNYYIDLLAYPKYSCICYIWLIILTLISSYIINIVLIPIINYINSKGCNYIGYFHFLNNKAI